MYFILLKISIYLILFAVCKSLQCSNQEGQKMKCGSFGSDSSEEICLQNSFCCYNETSKPPCYVNMGKLAKYANEIFLRCFFIQILMSQLRKTKQ